MAPLGSPRKKTSQFSGAAALFRKKETELQTAMANDPLLSTMKFAGRTGYATATTNKKKDSLSPPSFVSPGRVKSANDPRSIWKNSGVMSPPPFMKGSPKKGGTKSHMKSPATVGGRIGGRGSASNKMKDTKKMLLPPPLVSPGRYKSSNDPGKGWKNSGIMSPPPLTTSQKDETATRSDTKRDRIGRTPSPPQKSSNVSNKARVSDFAISPMPRAKFKAAPDITIHVKRDIQRSINARSAKFSRYKTQNDSSPPDYSHLPEHVRKAREREDRLRLAEEEKEFRAASLVHAMCLGWYVRTVRYPKLAVVLREEKERNKAILTIQKTFRMYLPRKRYLRRQDCKRRRERNQKKIAKIQKSISKMKKKTKQEIKEMKKEFELKKKGLEEETRNEVKEDEEQYHRVQQSGYDMAKYLKEENAKLMNSIQNIAKEQRILGKQFDLLSDKSEEISMYFDSLKEWVEAKKESIAKAEAARQKCRNRYLPMYREELFNRDKHCVAEFRIKELYKAQIEEIIERIELRGTDPSLVKSIKKELKSCKKTLKEVPEIPMPEGLQYILKST